MDYNEMIDSQFKKKPEDSNWGSMDYLPGYLTGLRKRKPVINANKYDVNQAIQNNVIPNQPDVVNTPSAGTSQPIFNVPKTTAPVIQEQPKPDAYNEYWKTPVIGKMPLDQFVQMAGMLSNSLAPDTPMGRLGGELYKQGSIASAERARREYEAPEKNLRTRLLNTQINQAEQKAPEAWDSMYNALNNTLNPKTGKLYTQPEIVKEFETAKAIPKEYKPSMHYVAGSNGDISIYRDGELIKGTGKGVDITDQIATTKEDDKGNVTLINKAGDVVKTISGIGKTKSEPRPKSAPPLKPYITPEGKMDYLPNNVKPPKGYKPYSKEQGKQPQLTMPEAKALSDAAKKYESATESDRSIADEVAAQNGLAIVKKTSVEKKAWYNPSRYGKNDTFEKSNYVLVKQKQIDEKIARNIMKEAGNNPDKARQIAKERGFKF